MEYIDLHHEMIEICSGLAICKTCGCVAAVPFQLSDKETLSALDSPEAIQRYARVISEFLLSEGIHHTAVAVFCKENEKGTDPAATCPRSRQNPFDVKFSGVIR